MLRGLLVITQHAKISDTFTHGKPVEIELNRFQIFFNHFFVSAANESIVNALEEKAVSVLEMAFEVKIRKKKMPKHALAFNVHQVINRKAHITQRKMEKRSGVTDSARVCLLKTEMICGKNFVHHFPISEKPNDVEILFVKNERSRD